MTRKFSNAVPIVVGERPLVNMEPRWLLCPDGRLPWVGDASTA